MKIEFNEKKISESVQNSTDKAINEAFRGYQIKDAIGKAVVEEIISGTLIESVRQAAKNIKTEALILELTKQVQGAMSKAVLNFMNEGLIETVCKLRGIGDYDKESREIVRKEIINCNCHCKEQ